MTISQAVRQFKYKLIKGALERCDGDVAKTARMLGANRNSVQRWVKILGLEEFVAQTRADRIRVRLGQLGLPKMVHEKIKSRLGL